MSGVNLLPQVEEDALLAAARLMALPRAWGSTIQHGGKDDGTFKRRKVGGGDALRDSLLTEDAYVFLIQKGWTIQASVTNYDGTQYTGFQRFAVFDVDSSDPDIPKLVVKLISSELTDLGLNNLNCDSGVKGYHNYTFFDAPVHQDDVLEFQKQVMKQVEDKIRKYSLGELIDGPGNSWYFFSKDKPYDPTKDVLQQEYCHIESLIAGGHGLMIKAIFSPHQKDRSRMSLPMTLTQIEKHDRTKKITEKDVKRAEKLIKRTHKNSFKSILTIGGGSHRSEPKPLRSVNLRHYKKIGLSKFHTPEPEEIIERLKKNKNRTPQQENELREARLLKKKLDNTKDEIIGRILNVPCLEDCFDKAISLPGIYWERVVLVTSLSRMGYSMEEIAYFFKWEINDDADNANKGMLEYQVWYWYQRQYRSRCEYFQELKSKLHCCDLPCGRRSPDQLEPEPDHPHLTRKEDFEEAYKLTNKILDHGSNRILARKTTRSGFTTALPITAVGRGENILFVVPRTSISEDTFSDAILLARKKHFLHIKGFVLSNNMKACLVRLMEADDHRKRTGLPLRPQIPVPREDCEKCVYSLDNGGRKVLPVIDTPLFRSDLKSQSCMLETYRDEMGTYHAGFITYSKLAAIKDLPTEDADRMREDIFNFDAIVFDEISQFVESSPMEILLHQQPRNDDPIYDYFLVLDSEMNQLLAQFPTNDKVEEISSFVDRFLMAFKNTANYAHGDVIPNILFPDEVVDLKLNMQIYLNLLYNYSRDTGKPSRLIYECLSLLTEVEWYASKTTSIEHSEEVRFILPPKHKEMAKWMEDYPGKLIITDATMPYTSLYPHFPGLTDFEFGDPQRTAETQLLVADSVAISTPRLFHDENRLRIYVEQVINLHGRENIMVVLPNKSSVTIFRRKFPEIPPKNVTYQRSNETIGVACDKRVMIVVGAPYAPSGAFDWVSLNLVGDFSKSEKVWRINARNTFLQTVGRAKDPLGKVLSVVYLYGIRESAVQSLMEDVKWTPRTIEVPSKSPPGTHTSIGDYWMEKGRSNLGAHDISIIHMWKGGMKEPDIRRKMARVSRDYIDNAIARLELDDLSVV